MKFGKELNNLIHITYTDALNITNIEIDRQVIINQRISGSIECLGG